MKTTFKLLLVSLLLTAATGCGPSGGEAKITADKFMTAFFNDADPNHMLKYTTGDATRKIERDLMSQMGNSAEAHNAWANSIKNMDVKYNYQSSESEVETMQATICYKLRYTFQGKKGKGEMEVDLVNINGTWMVEDFDIDGAYFGV